jgi:hypothetical protein
MLEIPCGRRTRVARGLRLSMCFHRVFIGLSAAINVLFS